MHRFEKLNKLSNNILELNLYQNRNKWKEKLFAIEISKNESDKFVDLLIYKNHYVLIKKLNAFLGKQDCRCFCRRCLNSYTIENKIIKQKQQCDLKKKQLVLELRLNLMFLGKSFS